MKLSPLLQAIRLCLFGLLLTACHNTDRDNPLDPQLTPAVELQVSLDDTTGTAALSWTAYQGDATFAAYWVLRRSQELQAVDTLAVLSAVNQTAFVDSSLAPNTAYVYRVSVLNSSGFETPSEQQSTAGYFAGPVQLLSAEIDPLQGVAELSWSRYVGIRFMRYQIERRAGDEDEFASIAQIESAADTTFGDSALDPDRSYFYRIVVEAAGREWTSNRSGREGFSLAPVELVAARIDSAAGTVALSWSRFAGPGFQNYQVQRRVVGTDQAEVLATVETVADISYVDETALAEVDYIYSVLVQAADQTLISNSLERRLSLPSVQLQELSFDSATASATLAWTAYEGPRFAAYRVLRSTAGEITRVVAELAELNTTTASDSGLVGNTEYSYRIAVVTQREEEVQSEALGGALHRLVASWPLDLQDLNWEGSERVRLYCEEAGQITALVFSNRGARLLFFDTEGALLEEQVLVHDPFLESLLPSLNNFSIAPIKALWWATAVGSDGRRYLSKSHLRISRVGRDFVTGSVDGILQFDRQGRPISEPTPLFVDAFPDLLLDPQSIVEGAIEIGGNHPPLSALNFYELGSIDNLTVSADGAPAYSEDFAMADAGDWGSERVFIADGRVFYQQGNEFIDLISHYAFRRADATWRDFSVAIDLAFSSIPGDSISISMGSNTFSRLKLSLHPKPQLASLQWDFVPPDDSEAAPYSQRFTIPLPLMSAITYRFGLGMIAGQISAWVESPEVWKIFLPDENPDERPHWASLALLPSSEGDALVYTLGRQLYSISDEGRRSKVFARDDIADVVGETRTWSVEGDADPWVGLAFPLTNKVVIRRGGFSTTTDEVRWPNDRLGVQLGAGLGQENGEMIVPLSFDAGPDGRVFVLDAGNARIQVFDKEGNYLTQWGRKGSGEGEFDFGSVGVAEDFIGSIAVDEQGFIYVADASNRRIQKFAP